jgi:hypothetical protein
MVLRYVAAIVLLSLGAVVALANWATLFRKQRDQHVSTVPLVGALLLFTGARQIPALRPYAWLAVLVDYGTLLFILSLVLSVRGQSSLQMLEEYVAKAENKKVILRLFSKDLFDLRQEFKRGHSWQGRREYQGVGTWQREGQCLKLQMGSNTAVLEPLPGKKVETWSESAGFPGWEPPSELSLAGIEFKLKSRR